ncbi:MAG TPA: DUF2232 domain-containing protein [Gammaproteobacteria bacterium]|nr:DUF2232 domain-containing protein [Gammaproteobacteria bacterium]
MRALAGFIMGSRVRAMLVAATSAVLALLAPPFTAPLSYIGGAAIGLVCLRAGPLEAVLVMAGAAAGTGVLSWLVIHHAVPVVLAALFLWVPVALVAAVLRYTVSLTRAVQTAAVVGLLVVVGVYAIHGDPAAWWHHLLKPVLGPALKQNGSGTSPDQVLAEVARLMTGVAAAALVLGLLVCLLLARWWQAVLYNPGGFQREFHALRMDPASGWVTLAVVFAAAAGQGGVLGTVAVQMAMVLLIMYALAGLALAHNAVATYHAHVAWLVGLYVAVIILRPTVVLLALAGLLDAWFDFRRRLPAQ